MDGHNSWNRLPPRSPMLLCRLDSTNPRSVIDVAILSSIIKVQESNIFDVGFGDEENRRSRDRPIAMHISRLYLSSRQVRPISFQLGKARIYGRLIWFRISLACPCQRIISLVRVFAIYKESSSSVSYVELSACMRIFFARNSLIVSELNMTSVDS